jgi:hypothetical protein
MTVPGSNMILGPGVTAPEPKKVTDNEITVACVTYAQRLL